MRRILVSIAAFGLVGQLGSWGALAQEAPKGAAAPAAAAAAPVDAAAPAAAATVDAGAPAAPAVKYSKDVGGLAKPIEVKNLTTGEKKTTGDLAKDGKVMFVLVNSVCNLCQNEMDALVEYKAKFSEKAAVYLVAVDMNEEVAKKAYEKWAKDYTIFYDPQFTLGTSLDLYSTPATVILDKGGKILYKGMGYRPDSLKQYMGVL
ncbi:MAG: TlpA family protein disulfide reductase [Deltaproteobacteria bacterium]|nr:TlpA family protein disulfide reductase [Deltaproteobacteria bacterium]